MWPCASSSTASFAASDQTLPDGVGDAEALGLAQIELHEPAHGLDERQTDRHKLGDLPVVGLVSRGRGDDELDAAGRR